jgi:hypothetical protein
MTRQRIIFILVVILLALTVALNLVSAQTLNLKNSGGFINETAASAGVKTDVDIPIMTARIIQGLLALVGIVFVVLFIYGGFLYMTSASSEDKIKKAKDLLKNAVIGLIIIMAAYSIAYYITTLLEGAAKGT